MLDSIKFLVTGVILGLTAGISPGPLLTLVISETLRHGRKEGIKVALAPFITDLPIILLSLFILSKLSRLHSVLGVISILGGLYLAYLAYENIGLKGIDASIQNIKPQSIRKGIIANFFSPAPYMFWIAVGAPLMLKAYGVAPIAAIMFIAGFYLCLVGAKIVVAVIAAKSKSFIKSRWYIYILRALGAVLLFFAVIFIREGLKYLMAV